MTKGGKRGEEIEGGGIEGGDTELCAALPNLSCLHGSLVVRKNGYPILIFVSSRLLAVHGSQNPLVYVRPLHVGYYSSCYLDKYCHDCLIK